MKGRCFAVIAAGGVGTRMGLPYPKQLARLGATTVIDRSVDLFRGWCERIVVAVPPGMERRFELELGPDVSIVAGGDTRGRSVYLGFRALGSVADEDLIVAHDAARPFWDSSDVRSALALAWEVGAVIYARGVTDTVKEVDGCGDVNRTVPRSRIFLAQTPQIVRGDVLKGVYDALDWDDPKVWDFTDEAGLLERFSKRVRVFPSRGSNTKITYREDLTMMNTRMRIGHGYDVHRYDDSRPLYLCGVEIPEGPGLLGHSDADVALHAIMDALLGAAGWGDIGRWFPDSDSRFQGIRSTALLREVVERLALEGLSVGNLDVTLVAETPRLAPHIDRMRKELGGALNVEPAVVNIKATTTEGLGFVGARQGMAAHAVVLLLG